MANVDDITLTTNIKTRLGITGDYQNALILALANDVKKYLISAGIAEDVVNDDMSVGVISRGVADLWNFGSGDGQFSQLFIQRTIQLTMATIEEDTNNG